MEPTLLEQHLEQSGPSRVTPIDVFHLARNAFLHGERIDMGRLASESNISRATLYRWVGGRERLLSEILYSVADPAFTAAEQQAEGAGAAYVIDVLERYFHGVLDSAPYRQFVAEDPELALRLCASKHGTVQQRLITRISALLASQGFEGEEHLSTSDLAYALLRIGESFVYNEVITGSEPDVDRASAVWRRMLASP